MPLSVLWVCLEGALSIVPCLWNSCPWKLLNIFFFHGFCRNFYTRMMGSRHPCIHLHVLNLGLLEASIYLETTTVAQGNHLSNGEVKHLD